MASRSCRRSSSLTAFRSAGSARLMRRIRIVERRNGNDHVDEHAEYALEVIAFSITQEAANDEYGQDQDHGVEDFKVEIQWHFKAPCDDHDERGVEESGLDGGAQDVGECEVHLVVPCLVDGSNVFCCLFDEGDEDETEEAGLLVSEAIEGWNGMAYASLM
jgi:hypothetical protein